MAIFGTERMRDLVQDRVANLVDAIEQRQRARERDAAVGVIASTKPPPGVVEGKAPVGQAVLEHQLASKMTGFIKIHHIVRRIIPARFT